jgi:GDP-L-fucose synthase
LPNSRVVDEIVGHSGEISFGTSRPDGTPHKLLDVNRLQKARLARHDRSKRAYATYLAHT